MSKKTRALKDELYKLLIESETEPLRPLVGCPNAEPPFSHSYMAAFETDQSDIHDGVMFCSKCGDVQTLRRKVPLDDRLPMLNG